MSEFAASIRKLSTHFALSSDCASRKFGFPIFLDELASETMSSPVNPALEAFDRELGQELVFGQVLISRRGNGYRLRHILDRNAPPDNLRRISLGEVRTVAQFTVAGQYRPLKAAPSLQAGWELELGGKEALEDSLNKLYPGALADWFAARVPRPPVTHFRAFTDRQTGMYRMTQFLREDEAAQIVRAGCHQSFCLKQRLWVVGPLPADSATEKSLIPCLEPCALLLEFARTGFRLGQEEPCSLPLGRSQMAADTALLQPSPEIREADFQHPLNPRRVQLIREKLTATQRGPAAVEER